MSKICPNCLRPVRTGANYCGFCGTSLIPVSRAVATSTPLTAQTSTGVNVRSTTDPQPVPKPAKARRPWVITPIILLFLVILLALIVRYWPEITTYLLQFVSSMRLP